MSAPSTHARIAGAPPLTERSPHWPQFIDRLTGLDGIDLGEVAGVTVWHCQCQEAGLERFGACRRVLAAFPEVDSMATIAYFQEQGANCDCDVVTVLAAAAAAQARTELEAGAARGEPEALLQLALRLYYASPGPADRERAATLFAHAAGLGCAEASYFFGRMCLAGETTLGDACHGLVALEAAAAHDEPAALYDLGQLHLGQTPYGPPPAGFRRNAALARDYLLRAAHLGCLASMRLYAEAHATGSGVMKNLAEATTWFLILAEFAPGAEADRARQAAADLLAGLTPTQRTQALAAATAILDELALLPVEALQAVAG